MNRITKKLIEYRVERDDLRRKKLAAEVIRLIEKKLNGTVTAHVSSTGGAIFGEKAEQTGPEEITFIRDVRTSVQLDEISMIVFYAKD